MIPRWKLWLVRLSTLCGLGSSAAGLLLVHDGLVGQAFLLGGIILSGWSLLTLLRARGNA